jgi:ribosomal protein L30/L7E
LPSFARSTVGIISESLRIFGCEAFARVHAALGGRQSLSTGTPATFPVFCLWERRSPKLRGAALRARAQGRRQRPSARRGRHGRARGRGLREPASRRPRPRRSELLPTTRQGRRSARVEHESPVRQRGAASAQGAFDDGAVGALALRGVAARGVGEAVHRTSDPHARTPSGRVSSPERHHWSEHIRRLGPSLQRTVVGVFRHRGPMGMLRRTNRARKSLGLRYVYRLCVVVRCTKAGAVARCPA